MATNWPVVRLVILSPSDQRAFFFKFNPYTIKCSCFCAKHNIFFLKSHTSGNRYIKYGTFYQEKEHRYRNKL